MTGATVNTVPANAISVQLDATEPDQLLQHAMSGVWVRLVTEVGPGSGWPVVEIVGAPADVTEYVSCYWGADTVEALVEDGSIPSSTFRYAVQVRASSAEAADALMTRALDDRGGVVDWERLGS